VGVRIQDALGVEIEVREQFPGPVHPRLDVGVVGFQRLDEVLADPHRGVERAHRPLEHHRDVLPAELAETLVAEPEHVDRVVVLRMVRDIARQDTRVVDGVEHRHGEHRLAAAALADDAEYLTPIHVEVHVVEHARGPTFHLERDLRVP